MNSFDMEWHRSKVLELNSQGYSQHEIARILQTSQPTINMDLSMRRQQAKNSLKTYIGQTLLDEYNCCLVGFNQLLKAYWSIVNKQYTDDRTKLQATTIINDCYKYIMDLYDKTTYLVYRYP